MFIINGHHTNATGTATQDLTAMLLAQPFGSWLVGLAGLIGMGGGLGQIWEGLRADFKKDLKFHEMPPDQQRWSITVGRVGMIARGIVFLMIGFFILKAALDNDARQARGLDGALQTLVAHSYGPWLLGAVALGLTAFGVYSLLCAKWIHLTSK
jgi:hypothetical protein